MTGGAGTPLPSSSTAFQTVFGNLHGTGMAVTMESLRLQIGRALLWLIDPAQTERDQPERDAMMVYRFIKDSRRDKHLQNQAFSEVAIEGAQAPDQPWQGPSDATMPFPRQVSS